MDRREVLTGAIEGLILAATGNVVFAAENSNPHATKLGRLNIVNEAQLTPSSHDSSPVTAMEKTLPAESISVFEFMTAAQISDVKAGTALTDLTKPIQNAINASSGKRLYFPGGAYSIASALALVSNIHLVGDGMNSSKLLKVGINYADIFDAFNVTGVSITDLWFYGNNQSSGSGNGLAIHIDQSLDARSSGLDFNITHCRFDNFKGDYWINVTNENATYPILNVNICNNVFNSYPGNARGGSNVGIPSYNIWIQGAAIKNGALVKNIIVSNNISNARYIKGFLGIRQGCKEVLVSGNIVNSAGLDSSIQNDKGAYAFMFYDSTSNNVPSNVICNSNIINGVRSCGVYAAAALNCQFTNFRITGQTDTVTTSLPKGGIVLNGCTNILVENNLIDNCAASGVYWVADSQTAQEACIAIQGNKISSCSYGVYLAVAYQATSDVQILGNVITDCKIGVWAQSFSGGAISRLIVSNNDIYSTIPLSEGVRFYSGDNSYTFSNSVITNNTIKTAGSGVDIQNVTYGSLNISYNTLTGSFATRALNISGSTDVAVIGNVFLDQVSGGQCLYVHNTQGSMSGNIFKNCSTSHLIYVSGSNDLGRDTPWWLPTGQGEFVQMVNGVEDGAAGSKYINCGWYYTGAAWVQQRALTGN